MAEVWTRFKRRKIAVLGMVLMAVMVFLAACGSWITPHDPMKQNLRNRLKPPGFEDAFGNKYWLGTDQLGRDVLSRVIAGARVSLLVAAGAVLIGGTIGLLCGLVSGYAGGRIDTLIMRIADMQLAFPILLLALTLVTIVGASTWNVVLVLSVTNWIPYAKVVRSSVLSVKELEFIQAARALGASTMRIVGQHILPNVVAPFTVVASFQVAALVIAESSLSFLGLGVPPSVPTWGGMLSDGRGYLVDAWWIAVFPGLMIMLTALSANLLGDGLRDAFDPMQRTGGT